MLRWQRVGTTSHAVNVWHQPVAGEQLRALCETRIEVDDRDVQAYDPKPQAQPCGECRHAWADMQDDEREQG